MSQLTCAFGSRWTSRGCGPCAKCRQCADEGCEAFDRAVFFGEYDRDGYTPNERALLAREATR